MDDELKQHLIQMEARLGNRFETRLGEVETRLGRMESRLAEVGTRLGGMEARMGDMQARMGEMEAHLIERMRDMQTELLKAFGPWARECASSRPSVGTRYE